MEYTATSTKLDQRMQSLEETEETRLAWLEQDNAESTEESLTPLDHLMDIESDDDGDNGIDDDDGDGDTGMGNGHKKVNAKNNNANTFLSLEGEGENRTLRSSPLEISQRDLGLKGGDEEVTIMENGYSWDFQSLETKEEETSPLFDNFKLNANGNDSKNGNGHVNGHHLNDNGNGNGNGNAHSLNLNLQLSNASTLNTNGNLENKDLYPNSRTPFTNNDNNETPQDSKRIPLLSPSTITASQIESPTLPPPSPTSQSTTSSVSKRWNRFIAKYHILILVMATWLFLSGAYSLPTFLSMTDSTPHPTVGSPSQHALQVFRAAYGGGDGIGLRPDDGLNPGIVLLWNQTNYTKDTPTFARSKEMRAFTEGLQLYLEANLPPLDESATPPPGSRRNSRKIWIDPIVNVTSYYSLHYDQQLTRAAKLLLTPDKRATVMYISFSIPTLAYSKKLGQTTSPHNVLRKYSSSIMKSILEYCQVVVEGRESVHNGMEVMTSHVPPNVTLGYTGILPFQEDMRVNLSEDLHRMHFYVLPLSLLILSIVLDGHFGLIGITVLSVGCVVAASSWVMIYAIWSGWVEGVSQFTPNVMVCLSFGLGIDYTLFLLSRVLQEVRLEANTGTLIRNEETIHQESIESMIKHAGHTVLISGITLMCSFLGLLLLPMYSLRSIGLGASVCVFFCIFMNLMIVPAVFHSGFGKYLLQWSKHNSLWKWCCLSRETVYDKSRPGFGSDLSGSSKDDWRRWKRNLSNRIQTKLSGRSRQSLEDLEGSTNEYTSLQDLLGKKGEQSTTLGHQKVTSLDESWLSEVNEGVQDLENEKNSSNGTLSSFWERLALNLLNPKRSLWILLFILSITLPIGMWSKDIKSSISFDLLLPSNCQSLASYRELGNLFGQGALSPYRIIFDGNKANKRIDSEEGFEVMHRVISAISDGGKTNFEFADETASEVIQENDDHKANMDLSATAKFTGIAWVGDSEVSYRTLELARTCVWTFTQCPSESLRELAALDMRSTSYGGRTTYLSTTVDASAYSEDGIGFLTSTRDIIQKLEQNGSLQDYTVVLEGGASIEFDASAMVYESFPSMIGITLFCVFILIGYFFGSCVTPIRSVISIGITTSFVYGLLVLVYQHGFFQWTGLSNFQATKEIPWLSPIMSFSIMVGLGLDYDVFLISRILEFRMAGYDNNRSIANGLQKTGGIITAAGLVMSVSFGGLFFSKSPVVYQWSFMLTTSVLMDTFIIRTCIVPILFSYTGKYTWFPRKMPTEVKITEE